MSPLLPTEIRPIQKSQFIEKIAEVTMRNLEVPESAVTIVLCEVGAEDWGSGRKTMAELRKARTHQQLLG